MKNVIKVVLLMCFSLGILAASSPERLAKLKEAREARLTSSANSPLSIQAASSDWTPFSVGLNGLTILTIDYKASGVVWASGWVGAVDYTFYSKDNGASWSTTKMPATTNGGYANLSAANDSVALIVNYDGVIFRTENRGAKWDTVYRYSTVDTAFFDGVKFVDATTAYAVGDADTYGMHLVKSTDAGKNWTRMMNIPDSVKGVGRTYSIGGAKTLDGIGNNVWVTYYQSTGVHRTGVPLIRTTDGGTTWTSVINKLNDAVGNVNYYFRSITFKDANNGWGVGRQTGTLTYPLYKTTDGGVTWGDSIPIIPGVPLSVNKVRYIHLIGGTTNILAVGVSGTTAGSWLSTDGGTTFSALKTPTSATALRAGGGTDATHMLAGGDAPTGFFKYAPSVKVTFLANTAGVPDTMKATSYVGIRGSAAQLTWDNLTPAKMTNTGGGDYWTYTGYFPTGTSFNYKFFVNAKAAITSADNGWEADLSDASNNRVLAVGQNDTTIQLQYVNGFDGTKPNQYTAAPFLTGKTDTVVAYIRVNMKGYELFDPAKHKVGIRGSFAASNWGTTIIMKAEKPFANGGQGNYSDPDKFYSVPIYWKKSFLDTASVGAKNMTFKFVIHNINAPVTEDWSLMVDNQDINQYGFTMPSKDTTVYWKWYGGSFSPPVGKDTVTVKFRVDLSTATAAKGFKAGDTVIVKSGLDITAGAVYIDTLKKVGVTGAIYESANRVIAGVAAGKALNYQYYSLYNLTEIREIFYDFDYTGTDNKAERRKFLVPTKNTTYTIADTSVFVDNMRRRPTFQSKAKLARNVNVTFTCDLRPAYYHVSIGDSIFAIQSSYKTLTIADKDSIYKFGVWINGPAVGGWGNTNGDWGNGLRENLAKKMWDDGTHGDKVSGDRIYSLSVKFYKDSANNTAGQVFKFGLGAGDNEAGKGGFGNNHVRNIDDADTIATIAEDFGSINPKYYRAWDYTKHTTGVDRIENVIPVVYELSQNYPNPFNPTTTINYAIPTAGLVSLKIYNILGQEVAQLVNAVQVAGAYQATFNASTLSSGVYFYKIESGKFSSIKKMMLLK